MQDNNENLKNDILNDIGKVYKKTGFITTFMYERYGEYSMKQIKNTFGNIYIAINEFNKRNTKIVTDILPEENNKINRDKLFKLARDLFEKDNYLTEAEFYKHMDIPINKFDTEFGSFTNFLKEAGLSDEVKKKVKEKLSNSAKEYHRTHSDKIYDFTREEAKNNGIKLFNEVGEITKESYLKYTNYNSRAFLDMFNTFTDFLKEIDLYDIMQKINGPKKACPNNNFYHGNGRIKDFTKEDCFKKAKQILISEKDLNMLLFLEKTNYDRGQFLNMFNNSFRSFLKEAGLQEEVRLTRRKLYAFESKITKEELIKKVLDFVKENDIKDLKSKQLLDNTDITLGMIKTYFKSFTDMKKELNLIPPAEVFPSKEEIIDHMWKLYNEHGKLTSGIQRADGKYDKRTIDRVFGSFTSLLEEMGLKTHKKNISTEDLLLDLQNIVKKNGILTSYFIKRDGQYSYRTHLNKFKTVENMNKYLNVVSLHLKCSISQSGLYSIYLISKLLNLPYELEYSESWLTNPNTNSRFRLDGYFPDIKLAIEYDGRQHYEHVEFFDCDLKYIQKNDKLKDELCKQNGVKLIRIRYDEPLTEEYLKQKLIDNGIINE